MTMTQDLIRNNLDYGAFVRGNNSAIGLHALYINQLFVAGLFVGAFLLV